MVIYCWLCENTSDDQFIRPDYPDAETGVCIDHDES